MGLILGIVFGVLLLLLLVGIVVYVVIARRRRNSDDVDEERSVWTWSWRKPRKVAPVSEQDTKKAEYEPVAQRAEDVAPVRAAPVDM